MRTLLGMVGVVVLLTGLTRGANEPKTPTLEDDRKSIQGVWELVPGKNPEGLSLRLEFEKAQLQIDMKRPGFNVRNTLDGVALAEAGKDHVLLVGGAKWPYTLDGDSLLLTMSGPYNGKLVLARVGKLPAQPGQQPTLRHILKGHDNVVLSVCFSPDGKRLASASSGAKGEKEWGEVKVWDTESGKEILTYTGHTSYVRSVCFSPDGKQLASASDDRLVKVWAAETGKEIVTLKGHTDNVRSICFSPDGKYLASASEDSTVKIWLLESGKEVRTIKGQPTKGMLSVCFSPDGKRLVSAAAGDPILNAREPGAVQVWETETGKELLSLNSVRTTHVYEVRFSPDGTRLAVACGFPDNVVKVFDAQTGQPIVQFKSDFHEVCSVSFSPDGKRLASCSDHKDRAVQVWDAQSGQLLFTLKGHQDRVRSVCFSPDGKRLASASSGQVENTEEDKTRGEIRVWDIPADEKSGK